MIYIKAVVKCDGWHGHPCNAGLLRIPATEEATLSVGEGTVWDVNADQREHAVLEISSKPDGWEVRQDGQVKCPTCIKDETEYRQAKHRREKSEAEKKKGAAIERGLKRMRGMR